MFYFTSFLPVGFVRFPFMAGFLFVHYYAICFNIYIYRHRSLICLYIYIHMHMYSKFSWVLSYMRRLFCFNWTPLLFPWLSFILWPPIFEPWCGWHSDRKNGRISCASGWDGANRLSMRYLHIFSIKKRSIIFYTRICPKKNVCPNKRPSMWKGILGRLHPNWKICFPLWWN